MTAQTPPTKFTNGAINWFTLVDGTTTPAAFGTSGNPINVTGAAANANAEATLLASATKTNTFTTGFLTNAGCKGGFIILDVTANSNTTNGLTISVYGVDPVTTHAYLIGSDTTATTGHVGTVATYAFPVYPGAADGIVANGACSAIIPKTYQVKITHNDAASATYSIGFQGVV